MISRIETQKIINLLKSEVTPTIGCTEPMSIALAASKAKDLLGDKPIRVIAKLSSKVIKNAIGVGLPNSNGGMGINAAIALGLTCGVTEKGLDCIENISDADIEAAKQIVSDHIIEIIPARTVFEIFYIELKVSSAEHEVKVIIAKEPDKFIYIKKDDEYFLDERNTLAKEHDRNHDTFLSIPLIYEFATKTSIDELRFLLRSIQMNKQLAHKAFEGDYGLNLGKMLRGSFEERMVGANTMPRLVAYTCAAVDVRMSGVRVPVMSNSGSGNMGIVASLPIQIYAEEALCTESKMVRALALSHLITIYIKQILGRLSAHCTCSLAAIGTAAGITYLMGGNYEQICMAIKNQIAPQSGTVCDGAKPSCTLRLSNAVSSCFQSAMMAMENIVVESTDGIVEDDVDRTIVNLSDIGRDASHEFDAILLKIMDSKQNNL